jgi:hypothetical protein
MPTERGRRPLELWPQALDCARSSGASPRSLAKHHHGRRAGLGLVSRNCQSAASLDQLIGKGEHLRIKFEPKRFGGFEVDHEVKFCRPYNR